MSSATPVTNPMAAPPGGAAAPPPGGAPTATATATASGAPPTPSAPLSNTSFLPSSLSLQIQFKFSTNFSLVEIGRRTSNV